MMSGLRNDIVSATVSGFLLKGWQAFVRMLYLAVFLSLVLRTPEALNVDKGKGTDERNYSGGDSHLETGGNTTAISQVQSYSPNERDNRAIYEDWVLAQIRNLILNATGRKNISHPPSPPIASVWNSSTKRTPSIDEWTTLLRDQHQRTTANDRHVEEVKFPPDEVSTHRNYVSVQFTLHNYTADRVEGAELMLLLRYNQSMNHHHHHHHHPTGGRRKPEVRRITIEVYKDSGNVTYYGNSSLDKAPMTTSVFRLRRTKWAKVLLIRSWIKETISSLDKVLRLRLVYEKSGFVDVVMTNDEEMGDGSQGVTVKNRRKLREGVVSPRRNPEQRIEKRNLRKRKRFSPILVIRQRGKSTA